MNAVTIEAPAKLNLTLRVLRKREDGFHEIDSQMVRIAGLRDTLTFAPAEEDAFTCDDPTVPGDGSNLVLKALAAYREAADWRTPMSIHLEKRIPHGAGLGGGSSDAAATLAMLDRMAGEALGVERLMEIGAALGSDVPFFLGPVAARATGRGEILLPSEEPPQLPVLLLKPAFGVATPDAYRRWADAGALGGVSYEPQEFPWGQLVNDLERPVFWKHLFLAEMKCWLLARREVTGALMSGSGSTMFALLKNPADAVSLTKAARAELDPGLWTWSGFIPG